MKNSSGEVGKSVNEAIFEGSIAFSSGSICPQNTKWETERLQQGLKIIIVERGELQCKLPGASASQRISGPCICAVWNQGESEGMQRFEPGRVLEHTAISLSPSAIDSRMAVEVQQQLQQAFQLETSTGPRLMVMASSPAIKALRAQVASCPLQGFRGRCICLAKRWKSSPTRWTALPRLPRRRKTRCCASLRQISTS
ncbi:Uncharacterised protein [Ewingella americana]|uniref:Uncharacterized protein n=1 Tax=Ewingella americana TaxID=41202 RepID=A0A377NFT4_9GAMM|nr:Uncharacterised protein [Ewingella americana]